MKNANHTKASSNSRAHRNHSSTGTIKNDFMTLRRDVMSLVEDGAKGGIEHASQTLREMKSKASEQAGAIHKKLGEVAGERPVTTILIAAAAGIVGTKALVWLLKR